MEAARAPHLHLLDVETGERFDLDECPNCQVMQDKLDGATKDIQAWSVRYANLRRDKEREARQNPLWPRAMRLFQLWKAITGHTKSEFDAARFEQAEPLLKKHADELHVRAVVGIAFDPFVTTRKNGSKKRHDGWDLLYRNADKWEEMACRAPDDWRGRATEAGWEWPEKEGAPAV